MKILHVALNTPQDKQPALERGLRMLGDYRQIDWMPYYHQNHIRSLRRELFELAAIYQPDLTFCQLQTPNILDAETLSKVPGIKYNWSGDVRNTTPEWMLQLRGSFTRTLYSNMRDVECFGTGADYLQVGYDEHTFTPEGDKGDYPEIVFLGNHYGRAFPLSVERHDFVLKLEARYGKRFGAYGAGYQQPLNHQEEATCYRSCKIAINHSHYAIRRYSSDRLFRLVGSGAFCLSHHFPEHQHFFEDRVHWRLYYDLPQLFALIDHYLDADGERETIARGGQQHCQQHHTWDARMRDLLRMYKEDGGQL